jgi:uncharacterized cupredoxin-like copper-binding protein
VSVPTAASQPTEALPAPAPVSEISIDAADFSYAAPEIVSEGWVRVHLTNTGAEPHHVQFLRLNDGVTVQQFEEALKQGEGPALAMTKQVGGVGAVAPGGSAQAVINLPAGEYVILCLIPSPSDHVAHHAKGMIKSLTVQAGTASTLSEPEATLTVRMQDFAYDMPASLPVGKSVIKVINDGPEPHELNIMQLAEGKTAGDVLQFLTAPDGPPPFIPVGGINGLDAGLAGYAEIDLQPGKYVAICNIPSPKAEGHPHFTLGMIKEFTVGSSAASAEFPVGIKFISMPYKFDGLKFNADGSFEYYLAGKDPYFIGTYSVEGNLLTTENPAETNPDCIGPATYQWSFDGEKLTFQPAGEDKCTPRAESNAGTFVMEK